MSEGEDVCNVDEFVYFEKKVLKLIGVLVLLM